MDQEPTEEPCDQHPEKKFYVIYFHFFVSDTHIHKSALNKNGGRTICKMEMSSFVIVTDRLYGTPTFLLRTLTVRKVMLPNCW